MSLEHALRINHTIQRPSEVVDFMLQWQFSRHKRDLLVVLAVTGNEQLTLSSHLCDAQPLAAVTLHCGPKIDTFLSSIWPCQLVSLPFLHHHLLSFPAFKTIKARVKYNNINHHEHHRLDRRGCSSIPRPPERVPNLLLSSRNSPRTRRVCYRLQGPERQNRKPIRRQGLS